MERIRKSKKNSPFGLFFFDSTCLKKEKNTVYCCVLIVYIFSGGFKWNATSRVGKTVHRTVFAIVALGNLLFDSTCLKKRKNTVYCCVLIVYIFNGGFKWNATSRVGKTVHRTVFAIVALGNLLFDSTCKKKEKNTVYCCVFNSLYI